MASVTQRLVEEPGVQYETYSSVSRTTKGGRHISYCLTVIQQPERARACGSGAKSSTDRRPVDPPPIVKFRIFEGDPSNENDITNPYNANFFLYATLEHARPIVNGRVSQQSATPNSPVLTGTPVAGMSYLDRPHKAGYFIFPDLSVRHEGRYRLSFTLFEDTKDDEDKDPDDRLVDPDRSVASNVQAYRRLEVKSAPFNVYSAKKFPGLAESTALSRLVADQGCRVRIRRDVRMRRRDNKTNKDWNDYEDETAQDRARVTMTPDPHGSSNMPTPLPSAEPTDRARSASVVSYIVPPQSRSSLQDLNHHYHQSHTPLQPSPGTPQGNFGVQLSYYPQQPYQQPQYPLHPHIAQGSHQTHQFQPSHYGYPSPTQVPSNYAFAPVPQASPIYEQQPVPHTRHDAAGSNNANLYHYQNSGLAPAAMGASDHGYSRQYSHSQSNYSSTAQSQPPTSTIPQISTTQSAAGAALPPLKSLHSAADKPDYASGGPTTMDHSQQKQAVPAPYATQIIGAPVKRSYGSAFSTHHIDQPLRGGARPDTSPHHPSSGHEESSSDEESLDLAQLRMSYRRADGTEISRCLPYE